MKNNFLIKNKLKYALGVTLFVIFVLFSFWLTSLNDSGIGGLIKQGNEVVEKIEDFRKISGRLPDSLKEIGVYESEQGPIFYEKRGDSEYAIFFSIGFDEMKAYYSDSKKWEDSYRK